MDLTDLTQCEMKIDVCKIPEYNFVMDDRADPLPKHRGLAAPLALLLVILLALMLVFTFYSCTEIRNLKQEIEILKVSHQQLRTIYEDHYIDFYAEDPEDAADGSHVMLGPDVLENSEDDEINSYYDYAYDEIEINESDEMSNDIEIKVFKSNVTKEEKKSKREKRNVSGYRNDGVTTNSGNLEGVNRRNLSQISQFSTALPLSSHTPKYETATTKSIHQKRSPPVDPSRVFEQNNPDVEFTVMREDQLGTRLRHKQRQLESFDDRHTKLGRIRPLPTIHFSGDTSKYVVGQHINFNGNGHLRHPQRTFADWEESKWVQTLGMNRHFTMNDGILTVKESGLYFIYAQIYYLDEHDTNGFRVYKNDETVLQCTTMTHSVSKVLKGNTCYTAGAEYLQEGDRVSVGDLSDSRYSLFEPGKSFFGVIKLGDIRSK